MTTWRSVVLVPVDDTALSHGAIRTASAIAWALDIPVQLVTVVSPGAEALATRLELEALSAVIADRARPPLVLRSNDVACALVAESARERALLCMSTHARSALGALVLGSTSSDVAAQSTDPIVLVGPRAAPMDRLDTIVVATPPDERSVHALDAALELAAPAAATVHLVRVEPEEAAPDAIAAATVDLGTLVARCRDRGVASRVQVAANADVGGALAWEVEDSHADLIVVTARHHPAFARLLGGDVVREVVRRAPCPVLVVPVGTHDEGA